MQAGRLGIAPPAEGLRSPRTAALDLGVGRGEVLRLRELSTHRRAPAQDHPRVSARQAEIPCFMQLEDETGFPHQGMIDFVDNRLDPSTGTIRARGVFPNATGWLLPGFFARVRVPGSGRYEALLVPDSGEG